MPTIELSVCGTRNIDCYMLQVTVTVIGQPPRRPLLIETIKCTIELTGTCVIGNPLIAVYYFMFGGMIRIFNENMFGPSKSTTKVRSVIKKYKNGKRLQIFILNYVVLY